MFFNIEAIRACYLCTIMNLLVLLFLVYLVYRFITGFLVPVFRATRQMKKSFESIRQQQEQSFSAREETRAPENDLGQKPRFDVEGEYIPFEEIPKP